MDKKDIAKLSFSLVLVAAGCAERHPFPPVHKPDYFWCFSNHSTLDLQGVAVRWPAGHPSMVAAAGSLNGRPNDPLHSGMMDNEDWDPIPDYVELQWRTPDGDTHEKVMPVAVNLADPKNWGGEVWFDFNGTGWEVELVAYDAKHYQQLHDLHQWLDEHPLPNGR